MMESVPRTHLSVVDPGSNGGAPLTSSTEAKIHEAVSGALANAKALDAVPDTWESKSRPGLKFKLRKISKIVIHDVGRRIPDPIVPSVHIKDQDRWEENPNDPAYILAAGEANYKRGMAVMHVNLTLGTKLIPPLPEDMKDHDDLEWSTVLEALGVQDIPPPGNPARYGAWLKMHAIEEDELMELNRAIQRYNGRIFEPEVEAAQDEMKSSETRSSDSATAPTA